MGNNHVKVKVGLCHLTVFFSKSTVSILIKLITKNPWENRIQVCSNEGGHLSPSGDNDKIVKRNTTHLVFSNF
jgi:hypothetical protein